MVESGDWLTPHYNYQDRWEKPVLYYWLTAATYAVAGTSEAAARLWSALSGVGLALLTWLAGRRVGLEPRAAWLAGAIVATSIGYVSMARQALPDLPLTFCITLGVWASLSATDQSARGPLAASGLRWWALAGLAAGLGFLLKGPVALIVPGVILLPIWWLERRRSVPSLAGLARRRRGVRGGWAPLVRRNVAHSRHRLSSELLRRRQPRAIRDLPLQRRAVAVVLPAGGGGGSRAVVTVSWHSCAGLRGRRSSVAPTPTRRPRTGACCSGR